MHWCISPIKLHITITYFAVINYNLHLNSALAFFTVWLVKKPVEVFLKKSLTDKPPFFQDFTLPVNGTKLLSKSVTKHFIYGFVMNLNLKLIFDCKISNLRSIYQSNKHSPALYTDNYELIACLHDVKVSSNCQKLFQCYSWMRLT